MLAVLANHSTIKMMQLEYYQQKERLVQSVKIKGCDVPQLTQEIFKGLPTYIKSAMINGYGILEFASVPKEQLKTYGRKWHISFYEPHQYPPVNIDWLPNSFDNDCKKYIACDTTNWQQSAINRAKNPVDKS